MITVKAFPTSITMWHTSLSFTIQMEQELIESLIPDLLSIVVKYAEPRIDQEWCDLVLKYRDSGSFKERESLLLTDYWWAWNHNCRHYSPRFDKNCLLLTQKGRNTRTQKPPDFGYHRHCVMWDCQSSYSYSSPQSS